MKCKRRVDEVVLMMAEINNCHNPLERMSQKRTHLGRRFEEILKYLCFVDFSHKGRGKKNCFFFILVKKLR